MNSLKNTVLLILIFIFSAAYLFVSLKIPVDGDGALHAGTIEVIKEKGRLISFHPLTLTEGSSKLPIFYPKLFYTTMTAISLLIGTTTYNAVVPIFGVLIGLFVFLIARFLFKNFYSSILSSLIAFSSYGLITNSVDMFRMETMVILLVLASIYCLLRYTETKSKIWFSLSIIFFAACLGTKQQAYIYAPIFPLLIFNRLESSFIKKLIMTVLFFLFCFILVAPIVLEEFLSTGTFFYPGVPLIGRIEKIIADLFNVNLYSVGAGWVKYGVGSERIANLKEQFSQPYNHLLFLNPFYTETKDSLLASSFYIPLFLFGCLLLLKKYYSLVIFIIFQQVLLFIQPLERYFLLNQIFAALIIGGCLVFFEKKTHRNYLIKILFIMVIVVFSVISSVSVLSESLKIPDYSQDKYVPGRIKAEEDAGQWLANNTELDSVIVTPRTHVFSYYSRRQALWINQLGGEEIYEAFLDNDVDSIHKISRQYSHSYLVIPQYWIIDGQAEGKWISYLEKQTVSSIGERKEYFQKVYSNKLVDVYKTL
ncbi:glycosyltransferase family 39 protein [Candidatus Roizmanbacteria bacterium]|nr:glycosyltransferase family 39 protein [Candidatus Roizmanbacteria bacterium]